MVETVRAGGAVKLEPAPMGARRTPLTLSDDELSEAGQAAGRAAAEAAAAAGVPVSILDGGKLVVLTPTSKP